MISERQLFLRHLAQTTGFPLLLEIEKAKGSFMFDQQGKSYLDLISGITVSNLGHGNIEVVNAVKEQAEKHMHLMVYGEFVQSPQVRYAQHLTQYLPSPLDTVYFVNSGSEAVEGSLKLAKRFTGRKKIAAFRNAYHGSTHAGISLMSNKEFTSRFEPLLPGIELFDFNDLNQVENITEEFACVIIEPVQGEAGVITATPEFLSGLGKQCKDTGTLLIFDEIQSGMGRTGSLFALEQYCIIPDILLTAKALGAGMPLGAFISSAEIMKTLSFEPILGHITTFGGHPVSCAAGNAGLKYMMDHHLISEVKGKHELFKSLLIHPLIRSFRGMGLMIAIEFDSFELNKSIIDDCIENGVLTDWFLFNNRSMRIAPPLTITVDEIRLACEVILRGIEKHS